MRSCEIKIGDGLPGERSRRLSRNTHNVGTPSKAVAPSELKMFSGEEDALKLFYVFENVDMRGKTQEEKATEIIAYLTVEVFQFYYKISLTRTARQKKPRYSAPSRKRC